MNPKDIDSLIKKLNLKTSAELDDKINDQINALTKSQKSQPATQSNIWRIIMKSKITKLAAAAVILIAAGILLRSFNGTDAWAKVIKTLQETDNIHEVTKLNYVSGKSRKIQAWLKNQKMLRWEAHDEREHANDKICIDNGRKRLVLDVDNKTAKLSSSHLPFENYMEQGSFEIILLFSGEQTPFKATKLSEESNNEVDVYEITYRNIWKGKAWVDAQSNLPMKIKADFIGERAEYFKDVEINFSYEPIPDELFNLDIPSGFNQPTDEEPRYISGKVVDVKGKGVPSAFVYAASWRDLPAGETDKDGHFIIKIHPSRQIADFPLLIRAFKEDDPEHVAWIIIRNPRHELRPYWKEDDGITKLEFDGPVSIKLANESQLTDFIPGKPGNLVFEDETDSYPIAIKDTVLEMSNASVINGRITDTAGKPID
ncbi:MAG: LolA family protein, partial [Planctomycetota bacterium]